MSFSLISSAHAAAGQAAATPKAGGTVELVMIAVFVAIFYFLILRPQNKRQKSHRDLVSSLQVGDEVIMSGGLLGKINKVQDDYLVLTISDGVDVKMQRQSVSSVLPKGTIKSV